MLVQTCLSLVLPSLPNPHTPPCRVEGSFEGIHGKVGSAPHRGHPCCCSGPPLGSCWAMWRLTPPFYNNFSPCSDLGGAWMCWVPENSQGEEGPDVLNPPLRRARLVEDPTARAQGAGTLPQSLEPTLLHQGTRGAGPSPPQGDLGVAAYNSVL